ncbi:hypothetical protein [Tenacibaculum halocynthiae]|uniref:hypothetical protein n=1 Tax=Tenacibaculum halocynthiae TaxID=1254437 RepID=UPI003D65A99C
MTYKYSICYPEKENIEYRNTPLSGSEVIQIAENYPWIDKLNLIRSLKEKDVYFNPALDFTCIEKGTSFCLTANFDKNQALEFSLWYTRPKKVKVLFGLLGEKEKMVVDDIWSISFNKSLKYLEHFIKGDDLLIEELYKK